ncbi:metal ABC transporter substrate-binding protein [Erysipelothrix urinaevulpis]|uniref:metal ABC transporter substrate-binding protein n=1 Tax=Erysipelothrix urinaevulpis TaxID=2683717 RepID=UPI00135ACAE5|nr:metal ABC transporter substrate-binding protein [Erysipelothrix urinaevulpis]
MKKRLLIILVLLLFLSACSKKENHDVVTSFFPIQSMVEMITGEPVNVILDGTGDAHDFEPTAKQRAMILESKLFIYNGGGFEFWFEDDMVSNGKALALSESLELLESNHDHEHDHDHGDHDPHVWLDPHHGKSMFNQIYEALIVLHPDQKEVYTKNYEMHRQRLEEIIVNYEALYDVEHKEFVVDHHAYEYLAHRYGLQQEAIIEGISDGDASFKQTERAIKMINEKNVNAIFVDPSHKNDVIKLVEKETGAQILDLYTIEKAVEDKTYFDLLEYNLEQLLEGLM